MQHYKQTTSATCAAAGLLMILNHFDKTFKLTKENEQRIWMSTATIPIRGSSIYALAKFAKKQDIPVRVVVGQQEYKFPNYRFKSYKKSEIEEAAYTSELYYKDAVLEGIPIDEREMRFEEIEKLLNEGKILLLRINRAVICEDTNKTESNYMPVYGIKNGKYLLMDPHTGPKELDPEVMREAFETVRTKSHRDYRMIIFG
ncbi:hypothetical protein DRJ17_03705 [Candidatus Woesearchaeota archaeon]|nr:MAG: hypothetical protein DRJ17_03705 [Candidatus Woesearchaeota archaeon]